MYTSSRRKTSSSTVVTNQEATTALLETEVIPSSSTLVTTPESQSTVIETEKQDLTNLEPQKKAESQQATEIKSAEFKRGSVEPEAYHHRARKCEFHLSSPLCHKQICQSLSYCHTFTVQVVHLFIQLPGCLAFFSLSQKNYDL